MDKIIPVFILIGIIIFGFVTKLIELNDIIKRTNFTNDYHNKFIELINGITSKNFFDQQLYYELTLDVKSMQYELGSDGIAHITDNLKGFSSSNYQLLINFLPELRNVLREQDNTIMMYRYNQSAQDCDDMFIRHLGTLNEQEKSIRKNLLNPFSCFADGVKFIVSLPILILHWLGIISGITARKIRHNWFIELLNIILTLVGFISSLMSIIMGWNDFWEKICNIF